MKNLTQLTDEQIHNISYELDDMFLDLAKQYDISALRLSGLVLARLIKINELANIDNFYLLLSMVLEKRYGEEYEKVTIQ